MAAATAGAGACLAQERPPACGVANGRKATIADVDERLEITLDSRIRLRLAGIEPPRGTAANPKLAIEARDALRLWLVGREAQFEQLVDAPDRWGRIEAQISAQAPGSAEWLSVAEALLDAGYARMLPDPSIRRCAPRLLQSERAAREAGIGLWRDPDYAVLAADDRTAFIGRGGDTIVVEGAVFATGETRWRTYVNFGPIRTVDFAVTLRRAAIKLFEAAAMAPATLKGQRLRVRGQLDTRFGPQIDVADPSAVEILAPNGSLPYSRPLAGR